MYCFHTHKRTTKLLEVRPLHVTSEYNIGPLLILLHAFNYACTYNTPANNMQFCNGHKYAIPKPVIGQPYWMAVFKLRTIMSPRTSSQV